MTTKKPGLRARNSSVQAALVAAKGEDQAPAPSATSTHPGARPREACWPVGAPAHRGA
jgi:hypothetical protein